MGLLGPPAFPQKAVFEAQTERKVSRWENKLEENTGTQVWEVCVFSPARHAPGKGLEAGNQLTPPPSSEAWERAGLQRDPRLFRGLGRGRTLFLKVWSEDPCPSSSCLLPAPEEKKAGIESKPLETWVLM